MQKIKNDIIYGCSNSLLNSKNADTKILDVAIDCGINTFDLARVYGNGNCEKNFGKWLKGQNREEIFVETKCCHPRLFFHRVNRKSAIEDVKRSLDALCTNYVDLVLLHRDDKHVDVERVVDFMNEIVHLKYAKSIGVSNWSIERIQSAHEYAKKFNLVPFKVASSHYSLAIQQGDPYGMGCNSFSGEIDDYVRKWCSENDVAIWGYSALAGGLFSGKFHDDFARLSVCAKRGYLCSENVEKLRKCEILAAKKNCTVAQISLAWSLCRGVRPILTTTSASNLIENAKSIDVTLSDEDIAFLQK